MLALLQCEKIYNKYGYPLIVTSTTDGIHSIGSLHYRGLGLDIRTRHLPIDLLEVIHTKIKLRLASLSTSFQVILESTHIHIEFDQKVQYEAIQNAKAKEQEIVQKNSRKST